MPLLDLRQVQLFLRQVVERISCEAALQRPSHNSGGLKKGRPEGPPVNRPGRQAGKGFCDEISAEDAAQQRVSRLQRSFNPLNVSRPDGRAYSLAVLRT
jgi:hypothetical protein